MKLEWDFSLIYPSFQEWNEDVIWIQNCFKVFKNLSILTKDNVKELIQFRFDIEEKIEKVWIYPRRMMDDDIKNEEAKSKFQVAFRLHKDFELLLDGFEEKLFLFLKDNSDFEIKDFSFYLEDIKMKNHHRVIEQELWKELESEKEFGVRLYRILKNVESKLPIITIRGEKVELNATNVLKYQKDEDMMVRENVIYENYCYLEIQSQSLFEILKQRYRIFSKIAQLKNYPSLLKMSLEEDGISDNLLEIIFDYSKQNQNLLQEYYQVYQNFHGINEMKYSDLFLDFYENSKENYSLEEANEMIKKSLNSFGENYLSKVEDIFYNGSLNLLDKKHKKKGSSTAYSYNGEPFIISNYQGSLQNIQTLSHEIGHAMHVNFAKKRGYVGFEVPFCCIEIPSKVHELFLNQYLLENTKSKEEKISFLNFHIRGILNTLFQTVRFQELEYIFSKKLENGEQVTLENMNELCYSLWQEYYKDVCELPEYLKYDWLRGNNLFEQVPFYNYHYPFALAISISVFDSLNDGLLSYEEYFKFLEMGGRGSVKELLSILHIDLHSGEFLNHITRYLHSLMLELFQELKS